MQWLRYRKAAGSRQPPEMDVPISIVDRTMAGMFRCSTKMPSPQKNGPSIDDMDFLVTEDQKRRRKNFEMLCDVYPSLAKNICVDLKTDPVWKGRVAYARKTYASTRVHAHEFWELYELLEEVLGGEVAHLISAGRLQWSMDEFTQRIPSLREQLESEAVADMDEMCYEICMVAWRNLETLVGQAIVTNEMEFVSKLSKALEVNMHVHAASLRQKISDKVAVWSETYELE